MTEHEAARAVIDTKGNCNWIDCGDCPLEGKCDPAESKQTFIARAQDWLARNREGKK